MAKRPPTESPQLLQPVSIAPRGRAQADIAYDRLEELLVTCVLPPGLHASIQDLESHVGLGRTPIHQAISRLASDTLVLIQPRHGLQFAPIDLSRERSLLALRRDMERFVVRLAAEQAGASQRNHLRHIAAALRRGGPAQGITEFNVFDRQIDRLLLAATGEAFLEHVLRPLHTIFRRIGWIYHSRVRPEESLAGSLDVHLAILDAVADGRADDAVLASDRLIAFVDSMFDVMAHGHDPALFDCNFAFKAAG